MKLVVATHNTHKTSEIRQMLGEQFDEIVDLASFPDIPPAVEDGDTFEANARIKALHASRFLPGDTILADDSGLEVDALDGAPGVYSKRFAGPDATDADNRARLKQEMRGMEDRTARFRCVLALALQEEVVQVCSGSVEGCIIQDERGDYGFGYDSLFIPEGFDRTFAELSTEEKGTISHRGRALEKMRRVLMP